MEKKILLKAQITRISAILNGTVAARDFAQRLPLTVSGTRSLDACCFPAAIGCFDPEETQIGWKSGDIALSGGWLKIFFDGEETSGHSAGVMVIGHISKEDLALIKGLLHHTRLRIEAAEQITDAERSYPLAAQGKRCDPVSAKRGKFERVPLGRIDAGTQVLEHSGDTDVTFEVIE